MSHCPRHNCRLILFAVSWRRLVLTSVPGLATNSEAVSSVGVHESSCNSIAALVFLHCSSTDAVSCRSNTAPLPDHINHNYVIFIEVAAVMIFRSTTMVVISIVPRILNIPVKWDD